MTPQTKIRADDISAVRAWRPWRYLGERRVLVVLAVIAVIAGNRVRMELARGCRYCARPAERTAMLGDVRARSVHEPPDRPLLHNLHITKRSECRLAGNEFSGL